MNSLKTILSSESLGTYLFGATVGICLLFLMVVAFTAAPSDTYLSRLSNLSANAQGVPPHAGILRFEDRPLEYGTKIVPAGSYEACENLGENNECYGPYTVNYPAKEVRIQDCVYYAGCNGDGCQGSDGWQCYDKVFGGGPTWFCDPGYGTPVQYGNTLGYEDSAIWYQCNSN